MAHNNETSAAYFHGLPELRGTDPEVAEDLGIPSSPEAYDRHVQAGHEVGYLLTRTRELPSSPAADALRTWIAGANRYQINHDIRGEIVRQVKSGDIRPDEVDGLYEDITRRRNSFGRWPAGN